MMVRLVVPCFATLLAACRVATPIDACDLGEEYCPSCSSDAECSWGGNACTESVYCGHQDAGVAVVQIGCSKALEYRWPDAAACGCVEGVCQQR